MVRSAGSNRIGIITYITERVMDLYFFGGTSGHLNARAARIASRHGAEPINYQEGGRDGYSVRRWCTFACPNRGDPYDREIADKVNADVERAGGLEVLKKKRHSRF